MASTVKSTTLWFGAVAVPVSLKKVSDRQDVKFESASPAGNPAGYAWVDKVTDERLEADEVQKGIFADGGFRPIPAEAIKAIDEAGRIEALGIEKFIPVHEVPFERAEAAYYISPSVKKGGSAAVVAKPLALLRDALAATQTAGIGKLTLRTKQRPFVVFERDGALFVNTLAFAEDFVPQAQEAGDALAGIATDEATLNLAKTFVTALAGTRADLDAYVDTARPERAKLVEMALNGEVIEAPAEAAVAAEPTIDLEAALLASIGGAADAPKKKVAAKAA